MGSEKGNSPLVFSATKSDPEQTWYHLPKKSGSVAGTILGTIVRIFYTKNSTVIEYKTDIHFDSSKKTITIEQVEPDEHNQFVAEYHAHNIGNAFIEKL